MNRSENFNKIYNFLKIWMEQNATMDKKELKSDFRAMRDALDLMGCCALITAGEERDLFNLLDNHINEMNRI